MINIQAIKNKILDLALHGQLTEQRPEDGNAEELYQQIQTEKQELIKARKRKKVKSLPEITEDEIPFTIPSNWKWVIFGNIITLQSGQDLKPEEYNSNNNGIPYLTGASNFNNKGSLIIDRWTDRPKNIAIKDDILLTCKGTVGKLAILETERVHIARQFMAIRTYKINVKFITFFMQSVIERIKKVSKGLIPGIERNNILHLRIPLPPFTEQKRIVEYIDAVFSVLDAIDTFQKQYANDLTVLKNKLINAAIQGKLTKQCPEDGTAEELYQQIQTEKQELSKAKKRKNKETFPEIQAKEIPFAIPDNWRWVHLASICYTIFAGGDKPQDFVNKKDNAHQIPVVANSVENDGILGYTAIATASSNTLTVAARGTIGFPCYRDYDYCPIVRLIVINPCSNIDPKYLYYVFRGLPVDSVGSSIPQLTVPMVNPKLLPLPPFAEQKRIVAKLDEALRIIEQNNISQTKGKQ